MRHYHLKAECLAAEPDPLFKTIQEFGWSAQDLPPRLRPAGGKAADDCEIQEARAYAVKAAKEAEELRRPRQASASGQE